MRTILTIVMLLFSINVMAGTRFYTIRSNENISPTQLQAECSKDESTSAVKLKQISDRLFPGQQDILSVSGTYGRISHRNGSSRFPTYTYEYYCLLDFKSKEPGISFDVSSSVMYTHISRANWNTACKSAYDNAAANADSPISVHWLGWTLFQGRYCEVTTILVKKVSP